MQKIGVFVSKMVPGILEAFAFDATYCVIYQGCWLARAIVEVGCPWCKIALGVKKKWARHGTRYSWISLQKRPSKVDDF